MADVIELELTYLAAALPENIAQYKHYTLEDIYFPDSVPHPKMRIRRKGDTYEFTKKTAIDSADAGQQKEENVVLTAEEYQALAAGNGRRVAKTRYYVPYEGRIAEFDVLEGPLEGLVVIDFEFDNLADREAFVMPDFCLADITQEEFVAGGILAGKSYQDIAADLARFNYQPLTLPVGV
jgi:CYTH domain-containing protein